MERPEITPPTEDARFPSGPWTGFFLQPDLPGRHAMELILTFKDGQVTGDGRDRVGAFLIRGRFQTEDGRCWWTKSYVGLHDVSYQGYNEGRGIWGLWEIEAPWRGGFHIWPEGMSDPTRPKMSESEDLPVLDALYEDADAEQVMVTVGAGD
ncbi:MAG: hypothetical protein JWN86_2814 [Planctomycetota bacterium]|nr:hypothetical protein [Planctomycetota bacterium]